MLAAAAAWDGLAAELHFAAASYSSLISGLTVGWRGPASATMAAAVAPYMAWISTIAGQAEQTATQAKAAAAAFEAAFAATVPPAVVGANRARLMALIATNFFGQNTPAIMTTQAEYIEMWAQDAAAMYGYAGSSATASQVTPFSEPPQTAAGPVAGTQTQGLPQLMSALPQSLHSLATPASSAAPAAAAADPPSALSTINSFITGPLSPASLFTLPGVPYLLGIQNYLLPLTATNLASAAGKVSKIPTAAGGGLVEGGLGSRLVSAPVSVGIGRAGLIGGLSVPQGWASAAPAIKAAAAILPESSLSAAPAALAADGPGTLFSNMALSGIAGRAIAATGGAAARSAGTGGATAVGEATTANIFVIPEPGE